MFVAMHEGSRKVYITELVRKTGLSAFLVEGEPVHAKKTTRVPMEKKHRGIRLYIRINYLPPLNSFVSHTTKGEIMKAKRIPQTNVIPKV